MVSKEKNQEPGSAEEARRATGAGSGSSVLVGRGRWSSRRKVSVVIDLLRGADLETLSRQNGVTAATISGWRDVFLASGEAGLKSRETDVEVEEKQRLKSVVADLAMSNELLREKIRHLEQNRPLAPWKSKP
jgi:transposase